MKYQTTINFPVGKQVVVLSRKTFFGYLSAGVVVLGVCYWVYLSHLTHVGGLSFPHFFSHAKSTVVAVAAPVVPSVVAVKNPVAAVPAEPAPAPVAKPAIPQTESVPVATKPLTAAPAAPIARVVIGKGIYMQLPPVAVTPPQKSTLQPQNLSDAERLAQAGNEAFGNLIYLANSQRDACGFLPADNLRHAQLGAPIPVYQIAAPDRASYQSGKAVKPLLKPTERWMFPVLVDDQVRCMLQVVRTSHNYSYVPGSTSKALGMAWNTILEKWPASEGYHPQLLINPEMPGYYFTVPELPEQNITDTDKMLYSSGDLSPASVILASWR